MIHRPHRRKAVCIATLLLLCCIVFATLIVTGRLRINTPSARRYPVRGVDVSHYQGQIDFCTLHRQGMRFAFIKATEGSTHTDSRFAENLAAVQESPLRPGFYHFFSYDSPGASQAAHFTETVPVLEDMLPPVIDVEFYGGYYSSPADAASVVPELRDMVDALRAHYGVSPILYCTQRAWRLYIRDFFDDCDLWIRDVYLTPRAGQDWRFWQYTDRAKLEGYSGDEPCIDVNVFRGTEADFEQYGRPDGR